MFEAIGRQLILNGFLPHGYCINWSPPLVTTYLVSDALIVLSYFSMPIALGYFVRHRPDFPYKWLLWMFAAFILACGTTHLMGTVILWQPLYWVDALLKSVTAAISVVTAIALWPLIPQALKIPSPQQLRTANENLQREIAERKRIEEELRVANAALLRSNLDLQRFAHVAAHDLQAPLRSISIFGHLLRRKLQGQVDEQGQEWMAQVVQGTYRMQALIDDPLAYSRLDSDSRPLVPTDCQHLFDEIRANLAGSIQDTGAEVVGSELPTVLADGPQVAQVFQNLISNGIKYNSAEIPRVVVKAARQGDEWIFSVFDNGIGIDPQHHDKIFEIFHRLHSQQEYPGTGIGLAICHRVIERHRGRIWIDSEEGAGTTFYFTLPAVEQTSSAAIELSSAGGCISMPNTKVVADVERSG